jgi:D-alanyl-D-alanine carboxypeptidase (penicillin-binding protein 5/6)
MEIETANEPKLTEGQKLRRQRERQRRQAAARRTRRMLVMLAVLVCAVGVIATAVHFSQSQSAKAEAPTVQVKKAAARKIRKSSIPAPPKETADTVKLDKEIVSKYAILIDLKTNTVIAEKNPNAVISPASMTKIMTVLVAAEHQKDLNALCPITTEVTDFCYRNGCSAVNFCAGEQVPVRDLFYGTILPSGADAAMTLANRTGGSQKGFVSLMNAKLKALGLSKTANFTNCIGIYDKNHHCTVRDMAVILQAAVKNDFCRQVLSTRTYTTAATAQHAKGLTVSNWFLRRIEDKDMGGISVQCAKTGYVHQSGNCAASYATDKDGNGYICVTGMSTSSWRCIYDHVALYKQFAATAHTEK